MDLHAVRLSVRGQHAGVTSPPPSRLMLPCRSDSILRPVYARNPLSASLAYLQQTHWGVAMRAWPAAPAVALAC